MKVLVPYDGTLNAKDALRHGLKKVQDKGGELVILSIFNREVFVDYDAIPQAEGYARAELAKYLKEAEGIVRNEAKGIKAFIVQAEGDPEKVIAKTLKNEKVDVLLCPTSFRSIVNKYLPTLREKGIYTGPELEPATVSAKS